MFSVWVGWLWLTVTWRQWQDPRLPLLPFRLFGTWTPRVQNPSLCLYVCNVCIRSSDDTSFSLLLSLAHRSFTRTSQKDYCKLNYTLGDPPRPQSQGPFLLSLKSFRFRLCSNRIGSLSFQRHWFHIAFSGPSTPTSPSVAGLASCPWMSHTISNLK